MLPCDDCYYYYYVKFSTGIFPGEKYPVKSHPRPQTSSTFLRICADPRSADFCIALVRFLIPSCSKWPASFFDTEPNAPTTTYYYYYYYYYYYHFVFWCRLWDDVQIVVL